MDGLRKFKKAQLTCPTCNKVVDVVLYEGDQGVYRINQFMCADDLTVMAMGLSYDTETVDNSNGEIIPGTEDIKEG